MTDNQFVTCIDLGSYYIKASAVTGKNGDIVFSVFGDSQGFSNGRITDRTSLLSQLKHTIRNLEIKTGAPTDKVILNIDLSNVRFEATRGSVGLTKGKVTHEDIMRAVKNSMIVAKDSEEDIIDMMINDFRVDGVSLPNPEGSEGNVLDVESQVVLAPKEIIEPVREMLEQEGITLAGTGLSTHGMANLMLNRAQRYNGAVLIDTGHEKTDVSIIKNNRIVFRETVSLGGRSITKDLSIMLKVPMDEAEKVKKDFALGKTDTDDMNRELIGEVITARAREILESCYRALVRSSEFEDVRTAVVYGGGLCSFKNISEICKDIFNISTNYITSDIIKSDDIYSLNATGCAFNIIHELQSEFILDKYYKEDRTSITEPEEDDSYMSVFGKVGKKARAGLKNLMDPDGDEDDEENYGAEEEKPSRFKSRLKKILGIE